MCWESAANADYPEGRHSRRNRYNFPLPPAFVIGEGVFFARVPFGIGRWSRPPPVTGKVLMDEPLHAAGLPLQGPHRPRDHAETLPPGFVPLRLILRPTGTTIELSRPDMIVGRHSEADVRLPLPDVSRRHCRFLFGNGNWVVMDLNSLNGVYVNEEPVGQATLRQGDRVRIGGFVFVVDLSRDLRASDEMAGVNLAKNIFLTRHVPTTFTHQRRAS